MQCLATQIMCAEYKTHRTETQFSEENKWIFSSKALHSFGAKNGNVQENYPKIAGM